MCSLMKCILLQAVNHKAYMEEGIQGWRHRLQCALCSPYISALRWRWGHGRHASAKQGECRAPFQYGWRIIFQGNSPFWKVMCPGRWISFWSEVPTPHFHYLVLGRWWCAVIPRSPHQRAIWGCRPLCGSLITGIKKPNQARGLLVTLFREIKVQRSLLSMPSVTEGHAYSAHRLPGKGWMNSPLLVWKRGPCKTRSQPDLCLLFATTRVWAIQWHFSSLTKAEFVSGCN